MPEIQEISLFSGIAGFSVAAHLAGWRTVQFVEWEEFPAMQLRTRFPGIPLHSNIDDFALDYEEYCQQNPLFNPNEPLCITGGFPCQPFSLAGKRKGTSDPRNKWPQMLRVIQTFRPEYVLAENVRGLLTWNNGAIFEQIHAEMEAEGYTTASFLVPALAFGAPHERYRLIIVAHTTTPRAAAHARLFRSPIGQINTMGVNKLCSERTAPNANGDGHQLRQHRESQPAQGTGIEVENEWEWLRGDAWRIGQQEFAANSTGDRREREREKSEIETRLQQRPEPDGKLEGGFERFCNERTTANASIGELQGGFQYRSVGSESPVKIQSRLSGRPVRSQWEQFPTQPPLRDGDDGIRARLVRYIRTSGGDLLTEKEIEQIVSKTINKVNTSAIKAGGNAVVPDVVMPFMLAINNLENNFNFNK